MKARLVLGLAILLFPVFSAGCADTLDKGWMALTQVQHDLNAKMVEFEKIQLAMVYGEGGMMDKYFDLAEEHIIQAQERTFLNARTVVGDDGVARLYAQGPTGPVAVSRGDIEAFTRGAIAAREKLSSKRMEWVAVRDEWAKVLDQCEEANKLTLATAEDIFEAKESAQAILEDITRILGELAITSAIFFAAM